MRTSIIWRHALHCTLRGHSLPSFLNTPLYSHWRTYRRECQDLRRWLAKLRREDEWRALLDWWSCGTKEKYAACKRWHGEVLETALGKWRKTSRYHWNKQKYNNN